MGPRRLVASVAISVPPWRVPVPPYSPCGNPVAFPAFFSEKALVRIQVALCAQEFFM
jgi:hypothetical protein